MNDIIAIDPGQKGGIAWDSSCIPMPQTNGDVLKNLRFLRQTFHTALIEHVVGFIPGGGSGAMFTFGESFGYLQGCLDALGFRVIRVRPQTWQKALNLGKKNPKEKVPAGCPPEVRKAICAANSLVDREWKNKLKEEAQRRFPAADVTLLTADACLILDYGRNCL